MGGRWSIERKTCTYESARQRSFLPRAQHDPLPASRRQTLQPRGTHTSPRRPREVARQFGRGCARRASMGRCRALSACPSANAASDPRPCPAGASGNVLCRPLCARGAQSRMAEPDELIGRASYTRRRLCARRCSCTMVRAWSERRVPHFLEGGTAARKARTNTTGKR